MWPNSCGFTDILDCAIRCYVNNYSKISIWIIVELYLLRWRRSTNANQNKHKRARNNKKNISGIRRAACILSHSPSRSFVCHSHGKVRDVRNRVVNITAPKQCKGAPLQAVNELVNGTKFGVHNNVVLLLWGHRYKFWPDVYYQANEYFMSSAADLSVRSFTTFCRLLIRHCAFVGRGSTRHLCRTIW